MKTNTPLALVAGALLSLLAGHSSAQISFSSGSPYTQNFNSLTTGGASSWSDNSTLPGWYASHSNGYASFTAYTLGTGSSTAGALYSFGATSDPDRALGSVCSGNAAIGACAYGVRFYNDTALAITNLVISYTGEQWRNSGSATVNRLYFTYLISQNPITSSDAPGTALGETWLTYPALDFITPITGGSAVALDGNNAANRAAVSNVLSGVVVPVGYEIFFRWLDIDDSGSDHGVSLDDLSITWTTTAPNTNPPSITSQPANVAVYAGGSASFTVSAIGKAPLNYQWYRTNSSGVTAVGTDSSAYSLSGVTTNDAGQYYCIVANDVGSMQSSNATLTVIGPIVTNIAYLRTLIDGNYNVADTNALFTVEGIVVSPVNMVSGFSVYSFFIEDPVSKKGLDVFHRGGFILPSQGEKVRVTASMLNFNGLLELNPLLANVAHEVTSLSSGNPLPAYNAINLASATDPAYMDPLEGSLIVVSNVYLVDTNSGMFSFTNNTVILSNQLGQTLPMFIGYYATEPQGQAIPPFCTSVRGILSQNDNSTPYTSNYQLLLTSTADLEPGTPPTNNPATPIPLKIQLSGANVVLSWTNPAFSLYSGGSPSKAAMTNNLGNSSPYTNPATGSQKYYQLIAP